MKLSILFLQRKCHYPGEYAPEAVAIADENTMDENPSYMDGEIDKLDLGESGDVQSFALITVVVPTQAIEDALNPKPVEIQGEIT